MRSFRVYNRANDTFVECNVPPHLAHSSWINYEASAALAVLENLTEDLKALKKHPSAKRVHKGRVALRRWSSVWRVLREDGWESDQFKKKVRKPLKKLLSLLGELRDTDVNLETGGKLGCCEETMELWLDQRERLKNKSEKYIRKLDIKGLLKYAKQYLHEHAEQVEKKTPPKKARKPAFEHLDQHLTNAENEVRHLAHSAESPEELHKLRLGIKRWRYLLTEFFGLTNLELVRAQQILGQIHDLDRLTPLLQSNSRDEQPLRNLEEARKQLLIEINHMRARLPYGLRPHITTLKRTEVDEIKDLRT